VRLDDRHLADQTPLANRFEDGAAAQDAKRSLFYDIHRLGVVALAK
jgi:hypothetical protein